ncbi:MAG TPA: amidohydrolase family protein [Chthoniobacterales bacterium]|nr:amidohydrolase family protein [Chthoniobacterales bacterium]
MLDPIDIHVHLLGNGFSGSGCRLRSRWWQGPFVRLMARNVGVSANPRAGELDDMYVRQLRHWLDTSSLAGVVILGCDDVHQEDGTPRPDLSRLYVPNDYLFRVAHLDHRLLPGISIHPARKDALDALEAGAEAGAVLLKLLPCVQVVDPSLPKYRSFWNRLAELGLPLLAHTGGEFSLPSYRPDLQDPNCLRVPLELGVRVIAAHCGAPALPWGRDYSCEFLELRARFPNLYGDISALSLPTHLRTLARLRENPERILFGSDYPVVSSVFWSKMKGWLSDKDWHRIRSIRNPLEQKVQLSRAQGFPNTIFSDVRTVLRMPEQSSLSKFGSST